MKIRDSVAFITGANRASVWHVRKNCWLRGRERSMLAPATRKASHSKGCIQCAWM